MFYFEGEWKYVVILLSKVYVHKQIILYKIPQNCPLGVSLELFL